MEKPEPCEAAFLIRPQLSLERCGGFHLCKPGERSELLTKGKKVNQTGMFRIAHRIGDVSQCTHIAAPYTPCTQGRPKSFGIRPRRKEVCRSPRLCDSPAIHVFYGYKPLLHFETRLYLQPILPALDDSNAAFSGRPLNFLLSHPYFESSLPQFLGCGTHHLIKIALDIELR